VVGWEPTRIVEKSCEWIVDMHLGIQKTKTAECQERKERLRVDRCLERAGQCSDKGNMN
jgi:hypothetical protein